MSVFTYVIADDSRSFCRMRRFIQARAVTQNILARLTFTSRNGIISSYTLFISKETKDD